MAPVLKTGVPVRVPRVRIPPSPLLYNSEWRSLARQRRLPAGILEGAASGKRPKSAAPIRRFIPRMEILNLPLFD